MQKNIWILLSVLLVSCVRYDQPVTLPAARVESEATLSAAVINNENVQAQIAVATLSARETQQAITFRVTQVALDRERVQLEADIASNKAKTEFEAQQMNFSLEDLKRKSEYNAESHRLALEEMRRDAKIAQQKAEDSALVQHNKEVAVARIYNYLPWGVLVGILGFFLLVLYLFYKYFDVKIARNMVEIEHSPLGPIKKIYSGTRYTATAELMKPEEDELPEAEKLLDTIKITSNGGKSVTFATKYWENPVYSTVKNATMRFLAHAIRKKGPGSTVVPGYIEMGISPTTWTEIIGRLKPNVETKQGRNGGTFIVGEYSTLYQLMQAVEAGRISLVN